ncbi:MAG TPA: TlpA family protein disulfide reductase [Herbaspirillum sp.]
MEMGIIGRQAPELRASYWIDADGKERPELKLAELGEGYKVLFFFQHWCPGCHSLGFPVLKRLLNHFQDRGVGFAVIQTVFEGQDVNTSDKLALNQARHHLHIPFGHDVASPGNSHPATIEEYRTGGTPWFVTIDPDNVVIDNGFTLDLDRFISLLKNAHPAT